VNLRLDIQNAAPEPAPDEDDIRRWIMAALDHELSEAEVSLRLVGETEMRELNERYRDRRSSTNVLSFPADLPQGVDHPLLGDIVVCPAVVQREALARGGSGERHWAHVLVHGSLHLLGYDHVERDRARTMEALETRIMRKLGYPCPYTIEDRAMAGPGATHTT